MDAPSRSEAPGWYRAWVHLASQWVAGLGTCAIALCLLRDARPWQWTVVPLTLLAANAGEWRVHRDLFHRRRWFAAVMYQRHTVEHHAAFKNDAMSIRAFDDLGLVLAPIWGVPLIVVSTTALGLLLAWAAGRNVGLLFIATCAAFAALYELLHLSYHLDPDGWIGRRRLIRALRAHHATHHDPKLMQRWNFNVTVPLWDWVRGTVYRG